MEVRNLKIGVNHCNGNFLWFDGNQSTVRKLQEPNKCRIVVPRYSNGVVSQELNVDKK